MNTVRTRKRLQELFDAERRRLRSPSPRPTSPMGSTIAGTHSPTCRMASPSPPPRSPVGPGKTYQHYWEVSVTRPLIDRRLFTVSLFKDPVSES
ncbi:hypothetical protein HPB51_013283 [Rhipicephalus microplus]|uniref:Uncharacterized protein n=1 Tax=Rhipicephalus microplus TaxID=6941 RepID=A0A9J6EHI9_RHIMP|nr:hypothetical protein HPB51_013283 [Rhipicephalus microplus]